MCCETGPRVNMSIRRSKLASEDLMKQACKTPKELKRPGKKNISMDGLGTKHGRIHVGKQNIDKLQVKKMKSLKLTAQEKKAHAEKRSISDVDDEQTANKKLKTN